MRRPPDGFGDFVGLGCHTDAHRRDVLNERDDRREWLEGRVVGNRIDGS